MKQKVKLVICNFFLKATCLVILVVNCCFLSSEYFSYPVIVKVAPFTPIDQPLPKLSLCFTISSLLNNEPTASFFYPVDNILNKTVGEIKEKTPSVQIALVGCSFRDWDVDLMMTDRSVNECRRYTG